MSPSEATLDLLADLPATVERLTQELATLRTVMDEIREDIGWAVRNVPDSIPVSGNRRITSMPLDPCAVDWSERLNRLTPADLPPEPDCQESRPNRILVRAEDFAKAMENVEQLVYCCESPDLQWIGEPDSPSIECQKCGFLVLDSGNVVMQPLPDEECLATNGTVEATEASAREFPATEPDDDKSTGDQEPGDKLREDDDGRSAAEKIHDNDAPRERAVRAAAHSQPLYMRIIFQRHMTDLVRAFGYNTISHEEWLQRAQPLIDKYDKERIREAFLEITEEVATPPGHFRLTDETRRYAVQILGKPPDEKPAPTTPKISFNAETEEVPNLANDEPPTEPSECGTAESKESESQSTAPDTHDRLSPAVAATMYQEHLSQLGIKWTFVESETLSELSGRRRLAPDLIVTGCGCRQLVAVRQRLTPKQREQMHEWLAAFGTDCEAIRVWPRKPGNEYDWATEVVAVQRENSAAT